ncbi:hypothetical protein F5148DRAFT_129777 [Russula earlei]|uniref:Uncharacterized protein n=1 Tax=Russula earlei TaxID=71964 RepID=A0ACC0UKM1_9AGAM|nr:hypothetical protein F5148DRAFT_129777 [Russula earlei]
MLPALIRTNLRHLLAILHQSSAPAPEVAVQPVSCSRPTDLAPLPRIPVRSAITDWIIDPTLRAVTLNHDLNLIEPSKNHIAGRGPSTPTLPQSPDASTGSILNPMTPSEDFCSEPEVYRPERGRSQLLSHRFGVITSRTGRCYSRRFNYPPTLLLPIATSALSEASAQPKSQLLQPPVSSLQGVELRSPVPTLSSSPFTTSTAATTPLSSRASSTAPRQGLATSAITPTAQILSLSDQQRLGGGAAGNRALNKPDVIRRAKDRRQQLLAELERAKVELWEATLEQGVLNHLMKDHSCI